MDNLDEFYREYGENLARRLPEIAHSSANKAFVFVVKPDDPQETQKYITTGKPPEDRPFFVWENFDEDLKTSNRDNYHLSITGSFWVLRKATTKLAQDQIYAECRKIVHRAISVIMADSENGVLLENDIVMDIQEIPFEKTGPINASWYGYGAQFNWLVGVDMTLDESELIPLDPE